MKSKLKHQLEGVIIDKKPFVKRAYIIFFVNGKLHLVYTFIYIVTSRLHIYKYWRQHVTACDIILGTGYASLNIMTTAVDMSASHNIN